MPWQETSPGHYERQLDPSEDFFVALKSLPTPPKRERWGMTAVAKFETDIPQSEVLHNLRQAWRTMRHDFPIIGAYLGKSSKTYKVPTEAEVEAWLDDTIIVEPDNADPEIIIGNYETTELCKLHYLPGSSQVLIRTSHWRTDGLGLCIFVNHFFKALADPREVSFGEEAKRLPPSPEEVFGICEISEDRRKAALEKWTSATQSGPFMGLPGKKLAISKGTFHKTFELSKEATSAVVSACKQRHISVTSAVHAALACVINKHGVVPEGTNEKKVFNNPHISIRRYLPDSFDALQNPFMVLVSNEPIVASVTDFDTLSRHYNEFYRRDHSIGSGSDLIPTLGAQFQTNTLRPKPQPASPGVAPKAANVQRADNLITPTLNSMGIFDNYIESVYSKKHNVEILDYWFSTEILGPTVLTYVWTFRGRMRFTTAYNEALFEPQFVQWVQIELLRSLFEGLQIQNPELPEQS